jgi:hypothetical protein
VDAVVTESGAYELVIRDAYEELSDDADSMFCDAMARELARDMAYEPPIEGPGGRHEARHRVAMRYLQRQYVDMTMTAHSTSDGTRAAAMTLRDCIAVILEANCADVPQVPSV